MPILCEPEHLYHAARAEYLTNTRLRDIRKAVRSGIMELIQPRDSVINLPMLLGRAVHKRVLEGKEEFDRCFPVRLTGAPLSAISDQFSPVALEPETAGLIEEMFSAVIRHPIALKLLTTGAPEGVVRAPYCGVPCQIRMDWFDAQSWTLVELKTTESLDTFQVECDRFEYYWQLAFYRALLAMTLGCEPIEISCRLIAVERQKPHRVTVCHVPSTTLAICQMENEEAIRTWQKRGRFESSEEPLL